MITFLFFLTFLLFPIHCQELFLSEQNLELSGAAFYQDKIIVITDELSESTIYSVELNREKQEFTLESKFSFWQMPDFYLYSIDSFFSHLPLFFKKYMPFDWEGLAVCGEEIYLVNEQVREVILFKNNSFTKLDLKLNSLHDFLFSGVPNAGLEGIALDCDSQVLYLGKEREQAGIISYDLKSAKIMNFKKGDELNLHSIADLFFFNNSLYVLDRFAGEIIKLNKDSLQELNRISFKNIEVNGVNIWNIFEGDNKYGLAEGLLINEKEIFLFFDNNQTLLSGPIQKAYAKKSASALLIIPKPLDF